MVPLSVLEGPEADMGLVTDDGRSDLLLPCLPLALS